MFGFFKSIVCLSMVLMVTIQCAPTDEPDMDNYELKFNITESYGGTTDTKDLTCGKTTASGTHPHAREACDDVLSLLNGTHTDPPPSEQDCQCTEQYDPVELTVSIILPNQPDHPYASTVHFANPCFFFCQTSPAPHFVDIGVVPPRRQNNGDGQQQT